MKLSNPVVIIDSAHPKTEMTDKLTELASELDFGFAFNESNFSDRVLRLEIVADFPESKSDDGEGCSTIADWARKKKRRREEIKRENGADVLVQEEVKIFPCNMPDSEEGVAYESLDCEPVTMIEVAPFVDGDENEIVKNDDSDLSMDSTAVISVQTVHISSPILAAKSPFFYKLFSNGQRQVTLRIQSSEADAFMDLLYFIYSYTLKTNTSTGVLDVLMAADKYEVASCVRYCSHLLLNFPMTSESALLYLDLPSSDLMVNAARSLTDAAIEFLAVRYKDINKFHEEVMNLPLAGIEAVLSSDDLQIASEDAVYDFALKWAKARYSNPEERRGILGSRLCKLIRFPYMTCRKLRKVIACNDLDPKLSTKLVTDALLFKCEPPYRQKALLPEESSHRYTERAYKYRPVKVIKFELPHQQCIVYFDMKKEECRNLFPSGRVYSQAFQLGGQGFFLSTHCNMDQQSSFHCFGLFLGMQEKGLASFSVDYEFSARQKPEEEFVVRYKGNYKFVGGKAVGYRNLFGTPWPSFMADDSQFFISGVLHISAQLTIRPEIAIMP